ncbi:unnamed protein product [Zymoseptoria tritici ST99CH_3D7]|uniref:non-specific serine/threonine protein kinase n=1 Tax=Zymoseptoria tritici (strain ST99CH_3D7) TaxID=1276538 RepID=A0A1X7S867_ZYMT9|nr:unnamed protein product [Zymoseptoria tritici ST99CH_3D7]
MSSRSGGGLAMSTEFLMTEEKSREDGVGGEYNAGDVEDTPRSELPPAVEAVTPTAPEATARQALAASAGDGVDYFTPQPATAIRPPTHDHFQNVSLNSSTASVSSSGATATGHIALPSQRPEPHTTISSISAESTDSTATVRPLYTPEKRYYPSPKPYPNQSLAALHEQPYVQRYRTGPPTLAQTNQVRTFASAIASQHTGGVRSAQQSPASPSHGLFQFAGPPSAPALESSETSGGVYASPFLHFTHKHVPKETHIADVDVDPISGRKLINHYEIVDELGRGTHGKVKLGRDLTTEGTFVAIKIVERFSKRRKLGRLGTTEDKVKKEVAILKKARHPNIVGLLEVIDDPNRKKVYIVLEWVERGEINWRVKGNKDIAMIEARRYERERSKLEDERLKAEDRAVVEEAQKRLEKEKRRKARAFRKMKLMHRDNPAHWSIEMAGDSETEDDEDDRLSRVSSMTSESVTSRAYPDNSRRPSRAVGTDQLEYSASSSSLARHAMSAAESDRMSASAISVPNSSEAELARRTSSAFSLTGLEGTMYGSYEPAGSLPSRVASLPSSLRGSQKGSTEGLSHIAAEILDSHLDPELEYVPIMTLEQCRVAFRDTLLGLQYLHYQGIVHRDIKPPNLLATYDNRVKISDFGVSYLGKPVRDGESEDVSEGEAYDLDDEAKELAKTVGTPAFYAPELCFTEPTEEPVPVTKAIDVWAMGITLFCMLFARTPFVDSEYVVMRQIADEEIYIPDKRLQPVDSKPKSRPTSHARAYEPTASSRRGELDLIYEDISDELQDLLHRLLIKDPRHRITLEEVRHHPWVLEDINNKDKWLEETDPSRHSKGKKIEVSKEDVNTAVVPLNLVERMRSGVKKLTEKVMGISSTRSRAHSSASASNHASPAPSPGSSSSTISQDLRRQSMFGDESIFSALKASRDHEHPLSKSVAVSPELEKDKKYFDNTAARVHNANMNLTRTPSRPDPPQRAMTMASAAGSMRTVRQSDYHRNSNGESPPTSPGLPGAPTAIASPGGSHLGGLLGGTGRLINTIREQSRSRRSARGLSSDRGSIASADQHGEPSLAVSQTTVAGRVQPPESLRDDHTPDSSRRSSPTRSRQASTTTDHLAPEVPGILSRISSTSSVASVGRMIRNTVWGASQESSVEDTKRINEERVRKLVREGKDREEEALRSTLSSPTSMTSPTSEANPCPPSPDDLTESRSSSAADVSTAETSLDEVSMSMSNPSIPSVMSEASSVDKPNGVNSDKHSNETSSDDTLPTPSNHFENYDTFDEGYSPDQEAAFSSELSDDYDSSDSDGGLVMRRKSATKSPHALAVAVETAEKGPERRGTGLSMRSKKSERSGSNNTMRKVRTRDSADGEGRRSLETRRED